jgi:opine dehydrogenase
MKRIAVIGGGHGGLAVAGFLGARGHEVRVCDVDPAVLEPVRARGAVELRGTIEGTGKIALATERHEEAVRGADLVMVVVPADAHARVAEALAPHVRGEQVIALHPGGAGGALELAAAFDRRGGSRPIVAEVESFTYASKTVAPATSRIGAVKRRNRVAALPARDTPAALALLQDDFPQFVPAPHVLQTSLNHMNAMLHVATMVLNAGRVEATEGGFEFYRDGVSPAVARVMEEVDGERMAVSAALGADAVSLRAWIEETYHVRGGTLFETIQTLHAQVYKSSPAPASLDSRYLTEDVPTGLVPIAALGELAGVAMPLTRLLIDLVSRIHGRDHWRTGRTLARMGIAGRTPAEVRRIVEHGCGGPGNAAGVG